MALTSSFHGSCRRLKAATPFSEHCSSWRSSRGSGARASALALPRLPLPARVHTYVPLGLSSRRRSRAVRCGTSSGSSKSSASSDDDSGPERAIFGRQLELAHIDQRLRQQPRSMTVVLGPRSCGKTHLIRHWLQLQHRSLAHSRCLLDCRARPAVSSPAEFAETLVDLGLPSFLNRQPRVYLHNWGSNLWGSLAKLAGGAASAVHATQKLAGAEVTKAVRNVVSAEQPRSSDMQTVLDAYGGLLSAWEAAWRAGKGDTPLQWPVLVVDEASVLMGWSEKHPEQLAALLRFFIDLTAASNRAHVVLAASDPAFHSWLTGAVPGCYFKTEVVGHLTEQQARRYLEECLGVGPVSSEDWGRVYQVCGGNVSALADAAAVFKELGVWQVALQDIVTGVKAEVSRAAKGGQGWTGAQFAEAALALLSSEHGAVTQQRMEQQLGRHISSDDPFEQEAAGAAALDAMVQANVLSIRPYSLWAHDIALEAFGSELDPVVTAPTPRHAYCLQLRRSELQSKLEAWRQRRADAQAAEH